MTQPCVYLVGTGPGDPSLISVRGHRLLEGADVVVYDHQVPQALLRAARPGAERIDVGPAAPRTMDQEAISILLAEKVREGKSVVRLKWGDPFVFDSGGREALLLREQGIAFEIVPGIPAAVGGAAYAGIPLTYPGADDVLAFVRGHEGESDEAPQVNWNSLASLGGTIVCYAGARQIGAIAKALVSHGRSAEEPAALVYNATTPNQQTVTGTLSAIAAEARVESPALFVIGRVAALREHLRWFDDRPLFGRRIVVTRSREQAGELIDMLEERGADAIAAPTIRIAAPEDSAPLEQAIAGVSSFDWIVFASGNAVDSFMSRLAAVADVRELKGVKICTVGPSTASRLLRYGIRADLMPAEYRAEALMDSLRTTGPLRGKRILLPRADIGRDVLAEGLRESGAEITEVVAYRTTLAQGDRAGDRDIYRMLLDGKIDAVTFTSASTVRNFSQIHGPEQAADLLRGTAVASIGPVTAEAAEQLGITTTVMPRRYTIPDLVDALVEHFRGREHTHGR
ncbi:MAG TPA: uroporphyrinogen-III C-methyltransferase [Vicinamibacterales bacterium]|nr:uroporphyrinogen-III C-methyltransferase [Vicinamibacterales bacterium]